MSTKYYTNQEQQVEFIIKNMQPSTTDVGLDIGCGNGSHIDIFKSKGYHIEGADINESTHDILNIDIFKDNLAENKYNFAYCLSPYFGEQWWEIDKALLNINRSLKVGSKFLFDLNNFRSMPEGTNIFKWNQKEDQSITINSIQRLKDRFTGTRLLIDEKLHVKEIPLLWRIFDETEFNKLCVSAGFKIIRQYGGFDNERVNWNPNKEKRRILIIMEKIN